MKSATESAPAIDADKAIHMRLAQANLCRVRGQWTEAIDHCVEILRQDPSNQPAHSLLGDIYRDRGKLDDAIQWYSMALDLNPTAADRAKLTHAERSRSGPGRQPAESYLSGATADTSALSSRSAVAVPYGTTNLMGVSPRRWLNWITLTSVAFLGLIIIGLIATKSAQPHAVDLGRPGAVSAASDHVFTPVTNSPLPPAHPGGPSTVPSGGAGRTLESTGGGMGLPPDNPNAPRSAPATGSSSAHPQSGSPQPPGPQSASPQASPSIPTMPVQAVHPLNQARPDFGSGSGRNDVNVPGGAAEPALSTLSGTMRLAQIQPSHDAGSAEVLVLATPPPQGAIDSAFREEVVRNVYRAARNAFSTNPDFAKATIYVQTNTTQAGGKVLAVAAIDRGAALGANPDQDSPDMLQQKLGALHWE